MNEAILIWLYLALADIWTVIFIPCLIAFFIFLIIGAVNAAENPDEWHSEVFKSIARRKRDSAPKFLSCAKKLGIVSLLLAVMGALYPSKSDLKYIVGGAVVWNVAQNEEVQKLPENLVKAANTFLEEVSEQEE